MVGYSSLSRVVMFMYETLHKLLYLDLLIKLQRPRVKCVLEQVLVTKPRVCLEGRGRGKKMGRNILGEMCINLLWSILVFLTV